MSKHQSTIQKEETLKKLLLLDSKLKFAPSWNQEVKKSFNNSGSFSFEALVQTDLQTAVKLVQTFK